MEPERIAADLLTPIWRGIDAGYKSQYARGIWQQFEDQIRAAAYTPSLASWFEAMRRRLAVEVRRDDVAVVAAVIGAGQDRAILRSLREDTAYLVLLVRVANDERRAAQASLF